MSAPTFSVNSQGVVDFVGPLGHAADQVRGALIEIAAALLGGLLSLLVMARKGH